MQKSIISFRKVASYGKFLLCTCVLCLLMFQTNAQFTVVFENAENEQVQVGFMSEPDSSSQITNHFIQEIARSIPRRYDFTSYNYTYRQVLRVIRLDDGTYEASIDINEAHCGGDVIYKDFDISDVLFPNHVVLEAVLYDKYKNEVATFKVNNRDLHWGYNKIAFKTFSDTIRQPSFTFNVLQRKLYFDEAAMAAFGRKQKLIDKYYLSKATINQGMQRLESFDFKNIDMIIVYDIMMKDVERQVEELYQLDFPGNLNLSAHDPLGYIDLFTAFSERCRQVRATEDASLASLDKIYYEQGLKLLAQGNTGKAVLYFSRSCNYNPYFVPSWYQRAKVLYLHDSVPEAADIIQSVLTTMNPEPAMSDSVFQFAEKILATLQQQGSDYLKLQKYNESLAVVERAIKFCSESPGMKCNEQIFKDYAESKYGLYQSYLTVAEKAIKTGRLDLAEIYVDAARTYQQANTVEIIGDAGADAVTLRLVKAYVTKADTLFARKKNEQALKLYDKAAILCDSLGDAGCREGIDKGYRKVHQEIFIQKVAEASRALQNGAADLAEGLIAEARSYQALHSLYIPETIVADTVFLSIQQYRYQTLVQTGSLSLRYLNYEDGLLSLEKAMLLSEKYNIRKNPTLDSLLPVVARPVLMTQVQMINALLERGETDTSGMLLAALDVRKKICGLQQDSLLDPLLIAAHEKHFITRCHAAKQQFEQLEQTADKSAKNLDYITAVNEYAAALDFIRDFTDCMIDTTTAYDGHQRALIPAAYLKLMQLAADKLSAFDTTSYFTEYMKAERYFGKFRVGYNGLLHTPLIQLCAESKSLSFKCAGINYYLRENDSEQAFAVLKSLYSEAKPPQIIADLQAEVGKALAKSVFISSPGADPVVTVANRTNSLKWYSPFKKSFLATWKTLAK